MLDTVERKSFFNGYYNISHINYNTQMDQPEGRGCDVPVSPSPPSPSQRKPARKRREFSPNSKRRAADLRKASRNEHKEKVTELKASGLYTIEMEEVESNIKKKQAEANAR